MSRPHCNVNGTENKETNVGLIKDVINTRSRGAYQLNQTQPAVLPQTQIKLK